MFLFRELICREQYINDALVNENNNKRVQLYFIGNDFLNRSQINIKNFKCIDIYKKIQNSYLMMTV